MDRKDSTTDKGGESLENFVARLSRYTVKADVIGPHDGGGSEEGVVESSEGNGGQPVGIRANLIFQEGPVEPDGIFAEITTLLTIGAGRAQCLILGNRRSILAGADPETGGEILAQIHVSPETKSDPHTLTILGRIVGGVVKRRGLIAVGLGNIERGSRVDGVEVDRIKFIEGICGN